MKKILIYSSFINEKYYFNPNFSSLPKEIQEELRIICVKASEKIKGAFSISFNEDGLIILSAIDENSMIFDEIEAKLLINLMEKENKELFSNLTAFYKIFCIKNEYNIVNKNEGF